MFGGNKNLKDHPSPTLPLAKGREKGGVLVSYTKTNKLITALYMVTDIIDKDELLRNKLRTLGIGIIEDINLTPLNVRSKISEIMSFLDIACDINIISAMNCNILRREFSLLDQSIKEAIGDIKSLNKGINLSDFFKEEFSPLLNSISPHPNPLLGNEKENLNSKGHYSIGHRYPTRLGVQKGSTLMKALSDKIGTEARPQDLHSSYIKNFEILKKQRRNDIINIIKTIGGNVTIKDIKDRAQSLSTEAESLSSYGEKTLQRELVLMVKDNVLNKVGEKRWSRYELVSRD